MNHELTTSELELKIKTLELELHQARKKEHLYINSHRIAKVGSWSLNLTDRQVVWCEQVYVLFDKDIGTCLAFDEFKALIVDKSIETDISAQVQENPYHLVSKVTNESGREWHMEVFGAIYKNSDDNTVRLAGTIQDVTESKWKDELEKAKETAIEKDNEYKYLTKNINGMIYRGNSNWHVSIHSNSEKLSGYSPEVFLTQALNWMDLILPEDLNRVMEESKLLIEKQTSIVQEFRIRTKSGAIKYVRDYKTSIFRNGVFAAVDGIVFDITKEKLTELELIKAKEKAEESDNLKSAFLANMSHEIRTPMNAILGFTSLLKEDDLPKEERDQYFEFVETSGNRLLRLISDIVDVSKIDANQLQLNVKHSNLNKLIDNLQNQFSIEAIKDETVVLAEKGLGDMQSILLIDDVRLAQVISNLLENALKFTKKGRVHFGYMLEGQLLKFYVKDNGVGIAPESQGIIFDRFTQVENGFTRSGEGTGLGLSIVKSLVELMNGQVWVESSVKEGAAFYFTIPYHTSLKETSGSLDDSTHLIPENDETVYILIAEDEQLNYLYLKQILHKYYRVIHAKNGKEAVEIVKNNPAIDLVLMDVKMPVMDGVEAIKKIREFNKTLPIIAQTAYAMPDDKELALDSGCNEYISKPISRNKLIKILNKYL